MLKSGIIWIFAFLITVFFAYFQRMTGPTYPLKQKLSSENVGYYLPRSCSTSKPCELKIYGEINFASVNYKRYKTLDEIKSINFLKKDSYYFAVLPPEPSAGKLIYDVRLNGESDMARDVIVRFKNDVPAFILIPHIIFMFLFMMLSVKIFIDLNFTAKIDIKTVYLNFSFLILGGFVLGPLTQYYAFNEFWTGFPYGKDLTDNKTLLMLFVWIAAIIALIKKKNEKFWLNLAIIVTFLTYLIPHSLFGSELDYSKVNNAGK